MLLNSSFILYDNNLNLIYNLAIHTLMEWINFDSIDKFHVCQLLNLKNVLAHTHGICCRMYKTLKILSKSIMYKIPQY